MCKKVSKSSKSSNSSITVSGTEFSVIGDLWKKEKKKISINNILMEFVKKHFNSEYNFINEKDWKGMSNEERQVGNIIRYVIWKKNIWFKKQTVYEGKKCLYSNDKTSPLKLCMEIRNKFFKNHQIIVSDTKNYGRMYGLSNQENLIKLLEKNNGIYEVIERNQPRKLFVDVDGYEEIDNIMKPLKEILPNIEFYISGSIGKKGKKNNYHSYHICSNYYFNNLDEMRGFKNYLKELSEKLKLNGEIDYNGVYKSNQPFKCINQSKRDNTKRIQVMMNNKNIKKHLVKCIDENDILIKKEFNKYLIDDLMKPKVSKKKGVKTNVLHKLQIGGVKKVDIKAPIINLRKDKPLKILSHIYNKENLGYSVYYHINLWCIKHNISFKNFYKWGSQPWGYNQKSYDEWEKIHNENKKLKNINISTDIHIRAILENQYGKILNHDLIQFQKSFLLDKHYDIYLKEKDLINNKYLPSSLYDTINSKYIVINAGMGKGKTYSILNYIKKNYMDKSVLWITNRVSLKDDIFGKANKLGFEDYKLGLDDPKKGNNKLICEIESIYKYQDSNFDLVIMDEIESLFLSFMNDTTHKGGNKNNYLNNYATFYNFLISAKKVFMMDAYISLRTTNYIKDIDSNEKSTVIRTENNNTQNRTFTLYTAVNRKSKGGMGVYKWLNDIVGDLKNGKKLYVYYPHKLGKGSVLRKGIEDLRLFLQLASGLEEENFRTYHSDSHYKDDLKNVNEVWSDDKIKCILTNSSISVGVSYENDKKQFDRIYLSYESFINPRDVIQTSARIRNPVDKNIRLCILLGLDTILNKFEPIPPPPFLLPEKNEVEDMFIFEDNKEQIYKSLSNLYDSLLSEYNSKCSECLFMYCKISGYDCIDIINSEPKNKQWYYKLTKEEIHDELKQSNMWEYTTIEDITDEEAQELLKNPYNLPSIDNIKLRKWKHKKHFKGDVKDDEMRKHWENPKILNGVLELFNNPKLLKYVFDTDIKTIKNTVKKCKLDNISLVEHQEDLEKEEKPLLKVNEKVYDKKEKNIMSSMIYVDKNLSDYKLRKTILDYYFGKNSLKREGVGKLNTKVGKIKFKFNNSLLKMFDIINIKKITSENKLEEELKNEIKYRKLKRLNKYLFIDDL
tara:strand:- start:16167 stop:19541 length:3375 start_codon:yes stop_codon:yes gene_type:complete